MFRRKSIRFFFLALNPDRVDSFVLLFRTYCVIMQKIDGCEQAVIGTAARADGIIIGVRCLNLTACLGLTHYTGCEAWRISKFRITDINADGVCIAGIGSLYLKSRLGVMASCSTTHT